MRLKELLSKKLSKVELKLVPSSFDIVGNIAIFSNFPTGLVKKEIIVGNAVIDNMKNIHTVCKKTRNYSGKYRTPKLEIIAGEKTKTTEYRENGVIIELDVEKVYFSPRLSEERKRISLNIKPNQDVLVMFSGCAIYPLVIAKNSDPKSVTGIEANPIAHKFGLENVNRNKLQSKIQLFKGDVKGVLPKLKGKFDNICMPLPKGAIRYLKYALDKIKKNGTIYFYSFADEETIGSVKDMILEECSKNNRVCKILKVVKCGQYSPGKYRMCIDFKVR
jgi:tRNA (guanine37-N1)-methyltransferase